MKEVGALKKLKVFKFHMQDKQMDASYQYVLMRLLFDVKIEDLRRKASLLLGGNVIDPPEFKNGQQP